MKLKYSFLLLITLVFFNCKKITKEIPVVQTINSNWQFKSSDAQNWKNASVPGNVYTDLLTHKVIPDPFVKTNEEKVNGLLPKTGSTKQHLTFHKKNWKKKI